MQLAPVGTPSNRTSLEQIPIPVQYLGSILDAERLRSLHVKSSVFILANERESFGQTLLEALTCGTPVIARDLEDSVGIFINGVNGALVAHDKPQKVAIIFWQHFIKATTYQSEARRASALRLTPTTTAQQHTQLYAQLIDDTQRANR